MTIQPLGRRLLLRPINLPAEIDLGGGKKLHLPEQSVEKPCEFTVIGLGVGFDAEGRDVTSQFSVKVGDRVLAEKFMDLEARVPDAENEGKWLAVLDEKYLLGVLETV